MSNNQLFACWAAVAAFLNVSIAFTLHASSVRSDYINEKNQERAAAAAAQAETNRQALRIECTHAGRLWLEGAALCLQPELQPKAPK